MREKFVNIKTTLLLMFFIPALACADDWNKNKPNSVSDNKWSNLKTAVHQAKLKPSPAGISGFGSQIGKSVSVNGNTALIGAPTTAQTGAVFVMEFDGTNWNENEILMPSDNTVGSRFGSAVSIHNNRALIGAYSDDENGSSLGSVYVFEFNGNGWVETAKLTASDGEQGDSFGSSVSLSNNHALIGAHLDNGLTNNAGSSYVFSFDGNEWNETTKLTASDESNIGLGARFGTSVSISGNWALVSAPRSDLPSGASNAGSAYMFEFDGNTWNETAKLKASDEAGGKQFGYSVSLSSGWALISAISDNENGTSSGAAYMFKLTGSSWNETTKLTASDGSSSDLFGSSVSISMNRAVVGAYNYDDNGINTGSAYVFDLNGNSWNETAKLTASDGADDDMFGGSVSFSNDLIMIGAYKDDFGSAYGYVFEDMNWVEATKFEASEGSVFDNFGYSVSLSDNRALIGAFRDESQTGAAYVFEYNGTNWDEVVKFTVPEFVEFENFGRSVSLSGDRAMIGAPESRHPDGTFASGSVYVFDFDGSNWNETAVLIASDYERSASFGHSVSLSGNRALIGISGIPIGSAYVFEYIDNGWVETSKLTASDGQAGDQFGKSVSLLGNRALIGALGEDNPSNSGAAYVFEFNGSSWNETAKLIASDGQANDALGSAVSVSIDRVLIGADNSDDLGSNSGAAYVFDFNGSNWIETAKLRASDGANEDFFGYSVSLSGDRALIGSYWDDDQGENSGSAYLFDFNGISWNESAKLKAIDGTKEDYFGSSVSLLGDRSLIGAIGSDDHGFESGSAYVFDDLIYINGFELP